MPPPTSGENIDDANDFITTPSHLLAASPFTIPLSWVSKWFSDQYIGWSISEGTLWAFSQDLWDRVDHDRRVVLKYGPQELSAVMVWFDTHFLHEQEHFYMCGWKYVDTMEEVGDFRIDQLTQRAVLNEGNHRLLKMVKNGHGLFSVKPIRGATADSGSPLYKIISTTSTHVTVLQVHGLDRDEYRTNTCASTVFQVAHCLNFGPAFVGPLQTAQVAQCVENAQSGAQCAVIYDANDILGVILWEKESQSINVKVFSVGGRKLKCEQMFPESEGINVLQTVRIRTKRNQSIMHTSLWVAMVASHGLRDDCDIADIKHVEVPMKFVQWVYDIVMALKVQKEFSLTELAGLCNSVVHLCTDWLVCYANACIQGLLIPTMSKWVTAVPNDWPENSVYSTS